MVQGLKRAGEPELLLLDEPMAGMSPFERGKVTELIQKIHQDRHPTALYCEHDMDTVKYHGTTKELGESVEVRSYLAL